MRTFIVILLILGFTTFSYSQKKPKKDKEKGKLIRVVENYNTVKLPSEVIYSIYKNFPDWIIVNDKFLYTQTAGDILKKQYNIKIKKNEDVRKLVVHPDGEIVKGL